MGESGYPIPAGVHRVEDVVRRSRFLTTLAHAPDPAAAQAFVELIGREMSDATHHCWAFVGPPGSTARIGAGDACEPRGTAGRPMLNVLLHGGIGEVVAVTSRWFGGTKLGTGGLSRAYAAGVAHALTGLPTERRVLCQELEVAVTYAHVDILRWLADELDALVELEAYGSEVRYRVAVPLDRASEFPSRLAGATGGGGKVRPVTGSP